MKTLISLFALLALAASAAAQDKYQPQANPQGQGAGGSHAIQPDWSRARDFTANVAGALSWDLLQQAELMDLNAKDKPKASQGEPGKGGVFRAPPPEDTSAPAKFEVVFSKELQKLDGKQIKVAGFMLPIEQAEAHSKFLLSAVPPSCPFCLPGGPNSTIHVVCKKPVKYSMDSIVLNGTMQLLKDDPSGFYYRLTEATEAR